MPKGYWIARVDVHDPTGYMDYVARARLALDGFGAKYLALGGTAEAVEGTSRASNVIIEFDSLKTAQECYHSAAYQEAIPIRQKYADGDIVIVEGVD